MASCSSSLRLAALTGQLGRLGLGLHHRRQLVTASTTLLSKRNHPSSTVLSQQTQSTTALSSPYLLFRRCAFATKGKRGNKKNAKSAVSSDVDTSKDKSAASTATSTAASTATHTEWVKFQQSIAVDGFETGQTTHELSHTKKSTRGGRAGRGGSSRKMQQDLAEQKLAERQRLTDVGGGQYPPLRYSEEETERLLAQAYAAVPPRAGKRGTRNLKRQEKRWHLVRQVRKKYKYHLSQHQERKMQKRSNVVKQVKEIVAQAPSLVERDQAYQARVFQRWIETMTLEQQQNNISKRGIQLVELTEEGQSSTVESPATTKSKASS